MGEAKDSLRHRIMEYLPVGLPATDQEAERTLLERLNTEVSDGELHNVLWELGFFYSRISRADLAAGIVRILLVSTNDAQLQAQYYLTLGQFAEQQSQYDSAIEYYARGLALKPSATEVAYLLHNNIGYCLNLRGEHKEAEGHCRSALGLDSGRPSAFKNLGFSLEGQGNLVGAAWAYVEATMADARDSGAFHLLQRLVADYPELPSEFSRILKELEACRKAAEAASLDQTSAIVQ